ncbi:GNAT family N-acetyltransferase [Flavobacteriaceae bacterium PRS1]|nr:GNAT family N-acetyltransferase [Flavobacteriaceae bacterium PRS1]
MTIITAHIEHLDLIVSLFDAYRVFYGKPSDKNAAKQFLFERLKNKDSIIFLALVDNKAVGFTQLYSSFSSVSLQPIYILNDLYVTKEYRKQGIGVALLNKAKELCREQKYKGLALQTETTNPAQYLYERLGWKKDPDLQYFWTNDELI